MEYGYIRIKENEAGKFIVEANIVNGDHWMTQHGIADLFNVVASSVSNTIRTIFKSGILREENVTQIHKFTLNDKTNEVLLYNLEAIIHIGFRVGSFESKIFREWIGKGFSEYLETGKQQSLNDQVVLNGDLITPFMTSLN